MEMQLQKQEKRLMVVRNWIVPVIAGYERVMGPVRAFAALVALAAVRTARRVRLEAARGTAAARRLWTAFAVRVSRRIVLLPSAEHAELRETIAALEAKIALVAGTMERQALVIADNLERREKRIKAYVGLARTLIELGRDATEPLTKAFEILSDLTYWRRKMGRIDSAMHYGCSIAELAHLNGNGQLAYDAYSMAHQYGDLLEGHVRQIRFAVLMSDVAGSVSHLDKPSWLSRALGIAVAIEDHEERKAAVSAVTTKMVSEGLAPPVEDVHVEVLCRCAEYGDFAVPPEVREAVSAECDVDAMIDDTFGAYEAA